MTEAMREQFEAWAVENGWRREGIVYTRNDEGYGIYDLNRAWLTWQAALRSPAVAGLVDAGDFLAMNGTDGMVRRWEAAKAAINGAKQ